MDLMILPLSSPIYNTSVKLRLISGRPTALRTGRCVLTAAKVISQTTQGWRKDMHAQAALYHMARYERLNGIWLKLLDKAMLTAHGRSMGALDYRICAIGRDEFPDSIKRVLRHCCYRSGEHLTLARAHQKLAKRP